MFTDRAGGEALVLTACSVSSTNGSTLTNHQGGYYAYGRTRYGGIGVTDHRFTAPKGPQKRDGTGLQYYNARYGW